MRVGTIWSCLMIVGKIKVLAEEIRGHLFNVSNIFLLYMATPEKKGLNEMKIRLD